MITAAKVASGFLLVAAPWIGVEAQEQQARDPVTATVTFAPRGLNGYTVTLNGKAFRVLSDEEYRIMSSGLEELRIARQEIAALESLKTPYDTFVQVCTDARTLDAEVIKLQSEQIKEYKDLTKRLDRLKNPMVTWEAGVGRGDLGPAAIAGVGIWRIRGWLQAHENGTGWFLGYGGRVF
jgi:hypothetical protein